MYFCVVFFPPKAADRKDFWFKHLAKISDILDLCLAVFFVVLRGTHHWVPRTQRLFGGQIIGQALVAAAKSVGENLYAHSLHCYFVRAGGTSTNALFCSTKM